MLCINVACKISHNILRSFFSLSFILILTKSRSRLRCVIYNYIGIYSRYEQTSQNLVKEPFPLQEESYSRTPVLKRTCWNQLDYSIFLTVWSTSAALTTGITNHCASVVRHCQCVMLSNCWIEVPESSKLDLQFKYWLRSNVFNLGFHFLCFL